MKKVVYEEFGNPAHVLKVVEEPSQPLTDGQVRVEVLRAPINPSDLIQIAGDYGVKPPLPATAGNEGLGRIVEGEGTGQLVLLPAGTGTWVSEMVCDPRTLVPMPEGDLDQLSMLFVNPATASLILSEYVDLKEGDWVIQSAANSAVGGYLVQLAKARGFRAPFAFTDLGPAADATRSVSSDLRTDRDRHTCQPRGVAGASPCLETGPAGRDRDAYWR